MQAYDHLVGHRFPGARVRLPEHFAWLWADCVGARPGRAVAHPSVAYALGLQGTGMAVEEILALVGASADDGVLLGECGFELAGPLAPGSSYECSGEIVAVERKRGARLGVFDLVTFRVALRSAAGEERAACSYAWVVPRREA